MAAITLRDILDNIKEGAIMAPSLKQNSSGKFSFFSGGKKGELSFFSSNGKDGELVLLDRYFADVLEAQNRIVSLTSVNKRSHGMSLLAHLLTIQLDPTLEAHYWVGDNIVLALAVLLSPEPKERVVWVSGLDRDALMRAIGLASEVCGSEFCASVTMRNTTYEKMLEALKRRAVGVLGLIFVGADLKRLQAISMLKVIHGRIALGGFLVLTPTTAKHPDVIALLREANMQFVGDVPGMISIYQRVENDEFRSKGKQ